MARSYVQNESAAWASCIPEEMRNLKVSFHELFRRKETRNSFFKTVRGSSSSASRSACFGALRWHVDLRDHDLIDLREPRS
mmetsp:Transcript_9007/g.17761  ORF Transcript_9007/g.17761 Transcript_9007/m.17761 type:complete len:81 (-) Transcript_9007:983-1225(-)